MQNFDCVQETTNSVGTGSLVLAGPTPGYLPVSGYEYDGKAYWRMTWGDHFELFYGQVTYDEETGLYSLSRLFVLATDAGLVHADDGQTDLPAGIKTLSLVATAASLVAQNDYLSGGFAMGQPAATGEDSLAIGSEALAAGDASIAVGPAANAGHDHSTVICTHSKGPGGLYCGGGKPASASDKRQWRSFFGNQLIYETSTPIDVDTLVLSSADRVLAKLTIFLAGPSGYAVGELRYVFNAGTLTVIQGLTMISTTLGDIPAVTVSVTTDSLGFKTVHLHFATGLPGTKFFFQTELLGAQ